MSKDIAYDESQDRIVHDCGFVYEDDYNRLSVQIRAYGATGKKKIQISREKYDKKFKGWVFAKVGRMTIEEFTAVARAVKDAFASIG